MFHSEKMTPDESISILVSHQEALQLSEIQKKRWYGKKILCLATVEKVELIEPMVFARQKKIDDWLNLEDIKQVTPEGNPSEFKNVRLNK